MGFVKHICSALGLLTFELPLDKTNKMTVRPAKTQISLVIHPVWSASSLSAWRKLRSLATHWAQAKTLIRLGRRPGWSESSLGAHAILSWGDSFQSKATSACMNCLHVALYSFHNFRQFQFLLTRMWQAQASSVKLVDWILSKFWEILWLNWDLSCS